MGDLLVLNQGRTKIATGVGFDPRNMDAFGRLVTTQPYQLGSYDHRIDKQPLYWDESLTGAATAPHNANKVSVELTTTAASGDRAIRQTYRQFEYRRGNAQIIYMSGILGNPVSGNVKRMGYFDDNNGAFFETNGTTLRVVRRSKTSGSVVDTAIDRTDFNGDKVDGTGQSGVTIDLSMQNLFVIDFSWLGTNIIRFCVVINQEVIVLHTINNANVIAEPWSQTGQLPVTFETHNTGASSSSKLVITCVAVYSSGSSVGENRIRGVSSGNAPLTVGATPTVVAGVRLKTVLRNVGLQAVEYDFLPASGNSFLYFSFILRATLTSPTWSSISDTAESLTGTMPTYTGGTVIETGHLNLQAAGRLPFGAAVKSDLFLGYSINNTPDSLILVAQTSSGSGSVYFNGYFKEVY